MKSASCKTALMVLLLLLPVVAHGFTPGKFGAMERRAAEITKARNAYIIQVLDAYAIPYLLDPQDGMVRRIQVQGVWHTIARIVIIPETEQQGDLVVVRGHNLYFFPEGEAYPIHLMSDLQIRVPH